MAYFHLLLLWAWVLILYLPQVFDLDSTQFLLGRDDTAVVAEPVQFAIPQPIALGLAALTFIAIFGLLALMLYRLPRQVGKGGHTIVQRTVDATLPVVTRHKQITKTQRIRIVERLTWGVKFALIVLPFIINLSSIAIELPLPHNLIWTTLAWLGVMTAAPFCLQALFAHVWRMPAREVW